MFKYSRELMMQSFFENFAHTLKLRKVLGINKAPVFLVHETHQAPEYSLFVLDIDQHQGHNVVQTLHITYFFVVVGVSLTNIEKFIITTMGLFLPQFEFRHSPIHIFVKQILDLFIRKLDQLAIQIKTVP